MRIYLSKNYEDLSRKAANVISAQIILKPDSVLGLATGSSPLGAYRQLIERFRQGDLDFSEITAINLDEYVGLSADHSQSYAYYMNANLYHHVNILPENTHIPDGTEMDAPKECARYDKLIYQFGGIDLQLLGIGENGHIGFNEPGTAFTRETHKAQLADGTIAANARFFDSVRDVPTHAYSMGIGGIMQARHILLIANGEKKASALAKALCGPVTPQVPASILQLHSHVTVVCDEAAAGLLPGHLFDSH